MADSVGLVAAKDQPLTSLRSSTSGYAQERIASKVGKLRHTDRIIRDGVGASERSGRWVMAFELFAGITKLIVSWSATIVLKLLAQLGIRSRPRWLLWLIRRPKSGKKDEKRYIHFFPLFFRGDLALLFLFPTFTPVASFNSDFEITMPVSG